MLCILWGNTLNQGTDDQRERWLRRIVSGDIVGAFATTEPDASSDLSIESLQTVAAESSGGTNRVLNGRKRWISNSPVANEIVVLARTGERMSLFIVDTESPGVAVGVPDLKMGNRGQLTADVTFDDVHLDASELLGAVEGHGPRQALATLTYGRIGIAAAGVGMAQRAFVLMVEHLSTRRAFGRLVGANQHWQFFLADRATEIANARNLYLKAALRLDDGDPFPEPEADMAKSCAQHDCR